MAIKVGINGFGRIGTTAGPGGSYDERGRGREP